MQRVKGAVVRRSMAIALSLMMLVVATTAGAEPAVSAEDDRYVEAALELALEASDSSTVERLVSLIEDAPFVPGEAAPLDDEQYTVSTWAVSGDRDGFMLTVIRGTSETYATAYRGEPDDRQYVLGSWRWSGSSATPQDLGGDEYVTMSASGPTCDYTVAAAMGGAGAAVCFPIGTLAGAVVCGAVGGVVGTFVGTAMCADVRDPERIEWTSYSCALRYCDFELTVRTTDPSPRPLSMVTFWDRKGQPSYFGPLPCRVACGDHSISDYDFSPRQTQNLGYVVDPDNPTRVDAYYAHTYSGRLRGGPTCFIDNTVTTWTFAGVVFDNSPHGTRSIQSETNARKPSQWCNY
jgi:hypothetical protein